jgi:purine-cytosine permease-like protein
MIGTAIALIFPIERYTDFLYVLGSVFSPLIAILLTDYFLIRCDNRGRRADAVATVSLAAGIAFYSLIKAQELPVGSTLTTIVFTAALHFVLRKWQR